MSDTEKKENVNIKAGESKGENESAGKKTDKQAEAYAGKKTDKQVEASAGKPAKKKKSALAFAIEFFVKIAVTAAIVAFLVIYIVGIYVNHSNSCYPMIKDGDLIVTLKKATILVEDEIAYKRGEEIRFGRVVAKAGDIVDIQDDTLSVNGMGVFENTVYPTTAEGAKIEFPYTVPENTVFVLNDYRSDFTDSRIYGGIPIKDTKGKIFLLLRRRGF